MCMLSCSVMPDSLWCYGLQPTRLLYPCNFPGKNTRVGCHFLLWGIFLIQESNLYLLHCSRFFTPEPPGKPRVASSHSKLALGLVIIYGNNALFCPQHMGGKETVWINHQTKPDPWFCVTQLVSWLVSYFTESQVRLSRWNVQKTKALMWTFSLRSG